MTEVLDQPEPVNEAVQGHAQALSFAAAGDFDSARNLLEHSILLLEDAVGPTHPDVANVLNALGVVAQQQLEIAYARRCFHRAWRIVKNILPVTRDKIRKTSGTAIHGVLQRASRDDHKPGDSHAAPAVDDPDGSDQDTIISRIAVQALYHLGNLEREDGRWNRAGRLLRRAVSLARVFLGADDLDTANTLNLLGMWCKFTGRFELGRHSYHRALLILRRKCDPLEASRSPEIATVYHNIGGLEHAAGKFAVGERFARKSVNIRRRAVGAKHLDYASDLGALAVIVADQGRADEAESIYREVLAVFEREYGSDHYEIAVLLHNMAALEVSRERYDSADEMYLRAAIMKKRWLADHPDFALTIHNLAILNHQMNRPNVAASYCRQALTIFEKNLVETHPSLVASRECWQAIESGLNSRVDPPIGGPSRPGLAGRGPG